MTSKYKRKRETIYEASQYTHPLSAEFIDLVIEAGYAMDFEQIKTEPPSARNNRLILLNGDWQPAWSIDPFGWLVKSSHPIRSKTVVTYDAMDAAEFDDTFHQHKMDPDSDQL